MQASLYHLVLRTAALTFALILLFDSGLLSPITKQLSLDTQQYLSQAIGMTAAVETTELNQITAGLTAREQELDAWEAALTAREINVELEEQGSGVGAIDSTFILSVLVFILLVLIVINYILDFIRGRSYLINRNNENLA